MKKYLNSYINEQAYKADESARKALNASTVSEVGRSIIVDGVNVETASPQMGDAVYHDSQKNVHFIQCGTVQRGLLPPDYTPIGVCGKRVGSKIYIIYKESRSLKFSDVFRWKVSGWKLDGSAHVCAVSLHGESCGDFTYTARDLETCCSQLNTFVKAHAPSGRDYIAYMEGGNVVLQLCNYNHWQGYAASISTLTVDYDTAQELVTAPGQRRRCGNIGRGVWNVGRYAEVYRTDQNVGNYNPKKPVMVEPEYAACLPAYLGTSVKAGKDCCAWLREKYGEGEEGWMHYLEANLPQVPFPKGMQSDMYGTSMHNTYVLSGKKVPNGKGTNVDMYPAAAFCASVGFPGIHGLEEGNWFGPTPEDYFYNFCGMTYGLSGIDANNCDPINRTLSDMGLGLLSVSSSSWMFSRYSNLGCWYAGSSGFVCNYDFCIGNRVSPLALYEL